MNINDFKRKNTEDVLYIENIALSDGSSLPLLKYPLLDRFDFCGHGFTTREGGLSQGIYSSLNLSFTRGDEEALVRENYRRLSEALGTKEESFVCSDQTHTTNVRRVGAADRGNGVLRPKPYTDVDGLITNEPDVVLSTFYADCVPLFFIDPVHKAVGLSHSGWRGTVNRMGRETLRRMKEEFATEPSQVCAAIGPSICQDCYEVSRDVAERFAEEFAGHEEEILLPKSGDKYQLDLWTANRIVLEEAGILPSHLAVTNVCTCCNPTLLFSHRASKGKRGNLGAFLYIKEDVF